MIWLICSIMLSASLMLIFRWFSKVGIHTQTAIVVNYLVCIITGTALAGNNHIFHGDLPGKPWFWPCLLLGILFILVFSAMGQSARVAGSALTAMASKMGLLIPVFMAVLFLGEAWNWTIIPGLLCTLFALVMLNPRRNGAGAQMDIQALILLLVVFFGSGFVDAGVKLIQHFYLAESSADETITLIFSGAFITGLTQQIFTRKSSANNLSLKDLGGGVLLGICNYGSMYTLIQALDTSGLPGSFLFPVNNLGVVMVTTAAAMLLFREVLTRRQWLGLSCAAIAIILLSIGA
jgi:drug/metabolite transporter (DMT)-like permease